MLDELPAMNSLAPLLLLLLLSAVATITPATSLTPLTTIEPTEAELMVFGNTFHAAIDRFDLPDQQASIVHVVGASAVEDTVNWRLLCDDGMRIVLVGPQVAPIGTMTASPIVPRDDRPGEECVTVVRALYSRAAMAAALGATHPELVTPDAIIVFNADVYMHYWRRTLAEIVLTRKPVAITFYCEFERKEVRRALLPINFGAEAIAACDAHLAKRYRGDADAFLFAPLPALPALKMLWEFEQNPHIAGEPTSCEADPETGEFAHGVRNAYWIAFEGEGGEAKRMPRDKFEVEEELRLEREARALRDGGGGEKEEL